MTEPAAAAALAAFYRDTVAPRMHGLPFVNPALQVEALGFRLWQGQWLGALILPWSLNLTLLPAAPEQWPGLPSGAKRRLRFPAGEFEFVCAIDVPAGEHHDCSLFSPALEFADPAAARATALAALEALTRFDDLQRIDLDSPALPTASPSLSRRGFFGMRAAASNGT